LAGTDKIKSGHNSVTGHTPGRVEVLIQKKLQTQESFYSIV